MGIKEITLPKELLNLPQPWGETDFIRRHEQIKRLNYERREIKRALNVLERCLHPLSQLPPPKEFSDVMIQSLMEYWSFTARWLADEMPTLDELRLYKVERKLKEYGIESPSPTLTLELAEEWLWSVVSSIEKAALYWVQDALMKTRDPILIARFLHIASQHWQKMDEELAQLLLSCSAMIGQQEALPLLESVEQNPLASQAVKETARDYRRFVLKHPEKWLPEPDNEKMPTKQSHPFYPRQPALGQLAYVAQ